MRGLLCFIVLLSACSDNDTLNNVCPRNCYSGPEDTLNVGVCRSGKTGCDEHGNPTDECIDEITPYFHEICDGLDNDCDGEIDEYGKDFPLIKYNTDGMCRRGGVCRNPVARCINGEWECSYPDTYEDVETKCDGLDNDCDLLVDEEIGNEDLCFDDEFWKVTNGECRPGIIRCVDGMMICDGQKLPSIELCDLIDNDCDGEIDNNPLDNASLNYDIVFIIDHSGTMNSSIVATSKACDAYVDQFESNNRFRFALVLMTNLDDPRVKIEVPFGDLASIRDKLITLRANGDAFEASLNSMEMVCNDSDPLGLEWRPDAGRLFFAFTDESAQSYPPGTTVQDVINSCQNSHTLPFVWGKVSVDFQVICANAGGSYFNLPDASVPTDDAWNKIFNDMNGIVNTLCGLQ